jgi:hypothetical protein
LPKQYFTSLEVEQGGIGAGTVIRFRMRVLGTTRAFRAAITEPGLGRVLVETDLASGNATAFTVFPVENGQHAQVTITTELKTRGGVLGWLERLLAAAFLRRVYAQELKLLAAFVENRARGSGMDPATRP